MGKGGGGGGGRKNSGGVGGRSARGGGLSPGAKRVLLALGLTIGMDPVFRQGVARAATSAANAAIHKAVPVTKAMRDKVREWAIARASKARGEVQTEGVAMAAVRAALNGDSSIGAIPKAAAVRGWRDIPDASVFSMGGKNYRGSDIKSLVREAVTAQKNHIANAPQLEAFTGPRYADKARAAAAGARVTKKAPSRRALKTARERVGRPKKA